MLLIYYAHIIIMYGITIFIDNLYLYTGSWFCYTSKVLTLYGNAHTSGHSFMVAVAKYVLIVHYSKVRNYGQEKVKTVLFWINIIYPAYIVGMFFLVRPDFLFAYDAISHTNRCLGKSDITSSQDINKTAAKLHHMCDIYQSTNQTSFEYGMYVGRTSICWLHVVFTYFNFWNILELFLYCIIFNFMRR